MQHLHRVTNPSFVKEEAAFQNSYMSRRLKCLVMDLMETESRNDCWRRPAAIEPTN
jgi:hypothetical protein